MTINGDPTRIYEVRNNRGIDGSSAINSIPDGYCYELENASLLQAGVVGKRTGYNLHGCELPVKCDYVRYLNQDHYLLQKTPIIDVKDLGATLYKYVSDQANILVKGVYIPISADYYNSVILQLNSVPEGIEITQDSLFVTQENFRAYSPLFILDERTFIFSASIISSLVSGATYNAYRLNYPNNSAAWSAVIANPFILCSGESLNYLTTDKFTAISILTTRRLKLTCATTPVLKTGDRVVFESCIHSNSDYSPNIGIVDRVNGNDIYIYCFSDISYDIRSSLNYLKLRYIPGHTAKIINGDTTVSFYNEALPALTPVSASDPEINTAGFTIANCLVSEAFINAISYNFGSGSAPAHVYGISANKGYVGLLNKYYNRYMGKEILVAGYDGNLFEETDATIFEGDVIQSQAANNNFVLNPDPVTLQVTIPLPNAGSIFKAGDYATYSSVAFPSGVVTTVSYLVLSVAAGSITVQCLNTNPLTISTNMLWTFQRTSNKIYLKSGEIDRLTLTKGQTIQIGNYGDNYTVHTIKNINKDGNYNTWIEIDSSITWESNSKIYVNSYWKPIYSGSTSNPEIAPITSSLYAKNSKDIYSANFDAALYLTAGVDGMWRYDGSNLIRMDLPAPPLAYWRNIPGTFGNLPAVLGSDGKAIGVTTNIRLTYYYVDNSNRVYESPVIPDNDITLITSPVSNFTDSTLLVEVVVASLPQNIGFPADKVKVRAYRPFTSIIDNTTAYLLDAEVDNNYLSPFTHVVIGKTAPLFSDDLESLYSVIDENGSNRPAPRAEVLTALDNKLFACGGYEPSQFQLICKQVFEQDGVYNSPFAAYSKIFYNDINRTKNELSSGNYYPVVFKTIPFGLNTTALPNANLVTFMTNDMDVYIPDFPGMNAKFTIDVSGVKGVTYADASFKFKITGGAALVLAGTAAFGYRYKLRTVGEKFLSSIDFNDSIFTAAQSGNDLFLSGPTKWIETDASSVLGTNEKRVNSFYKLYDIPDNIGVNTDPIATNLTKGGLKLISSGNTTGGQTAEFIVRETPVNFAALALLNKYIVIQMNRQENGSFVDKTLGNVKISENSPNVNFNSEAVWKITGSSNDGTFSTYTISLVTLDKQTAGYVLSPFLIQNSVTHTSALTSHGAFEVYLQDNVAALPVLRTDSFTTVSKLVTFDVTSNPTGYIAANDYIAVNFFTATGPVSPDFNAVGFPECNGVFKVNGITASTITIIIDKPPIQIVPTTATNKWDGAIFKTSPFAIVNNKFTVKYSVATVNNTKVGDWHFFMIRGWEHNEISSPFCGWFKVFSLNNATKEVTYWYSASPIAVDSDTANRQVDVTLMSGFSQSRVLICESVIGDTEYNVPVPVPVKNALSQELQDLALPLFEQKTDTEYTALSIAKRFSLAFNTVLYDFGFANWGGKLDLNTTLHPVNGFSFISHKSPVNRYRYKLNNTFTPISLPLTNYLNPFDVVNFYSYSSGYYNVYGNVYDGTEYAADTVPVPATPGKVDASFATTFEGSRIWWSSAISNIDVLSRISTFKYKLTETINSFDGENIIGAAAYQSYLVVAKNNSMYRISIDQTGSSVNSERVQSTVGSISGKNLVANESYLYFIHSSGVFYLDGLSVNPVGMLNRFFQNRVFPSANLLTYAAGYHNPVNKEVYLGVPYATTDDGTTDVIDGQFVYNYNSNVFAWSVNTNIPAVWWTRRTNEDYFSATDGNVYKKRTELSNTKFRDNEDAIAFRLRTRYVDMDDKINFKFIRNFIFQFGQEDSQSITVNYTWDFFKDTKPLTVIPLSNASYVASPYSAVTMVSNKFIKPVRGMVQPNRVAQLGLELINNDKDTNTEVFGVFIEGQSTNTRLITQKNQTR